MFGNILGKKKENIVEEENSHIVEKVSKMNLTEMRSYVNNRVMDFEICEVGLVEVMKKLTVVNETTSKTYIQIDDMDSKKKKAFELILIIAKNRHISIETVELIQAFIEVYDELIKKYDNDYKDIYSSRLADSVKLGIEGVSKQAEYERKRKVLAQ